MISAYIRACLIIREYHQGYMATGDIGYPWGIAEMLFELELMRRPGMAIRRLERHYPLLGGGR